ncbi:hypothetical protein [Gottfriedia acidiceleris]|uniref:Uncharacterized protein n=1 Tax=Gottfriedia acidiceleris TaxID=371036 RepID=A0ABY4JT54_9BACI|nr:hypothetical protein [Gottfriedia acidiceleris]UPM55505.1 hypothetical protein MY490_06625 [Gottfriedia acidiceleris]
MENEFEEITISELIELGTEIWRLNKHVSNTESSAMSIRFIRKLEEFLKIKNIVVEDLTGEIFDTGLAVNVIHTENVEESERFYISDTVYPAIFYKKQLIKQAVVTISNKRIEGQTCKPNI